MVVYKFMINLTGRYVKLIKMAKLNGDKKICLWVESIADILKTIILRHYML